MSMINDKKLTTTNKALRWNWFNLGKGRFLWQSEQYRTFLSMDEKGNIILTAKAGANSIWIKEDNKTYNKWKS